MSSEQELPALLTSLQNTLKLQSALMAKFEQREARMQAAFDQRMQALQSEVAQVHHRVDGIVGGASSQIAKEAKDAVAPVAARYDHDVSVTSAQLQKKPARPCGCGSVPPARSCCSFFSSAGPCWATIAANSPSSRKSSSATRTLSLSSKPITHPMRSFVVAACAPMSIPMGNGRATSASIGKQNRDPGSKV